MYSAVLMLALTAGGDSVDHGRNNCYGCYGCYTSCSYGCSCYNGCNSCHGGGLFGRRHGCHSCYSSCHSCYSCSYYSCSHYGCSYYGGCCYSGGGYYGAPGGAPGVPPVQIKEMPKVEKKAAVAAPATIVVSLPAEARLLVDGVATSSTSASRTLVTPELQFGSNYVYTMQAEVVRDGRTVTETQQVTVRGGEVSTVNFNFTTQALASR